MINCNIKISLNPDPLYKDSTLETSNLGTRQAVTAKQYIQQKNSMHLCSIGGSVLAWEVDLYLVLNSGPATSRMGSESTSIGPQRLISAAFTALFLQPAPVYCESKHRTAYYTECIHQVIRLTISNAVTK